MTTSRQSADKQAILDRIAGKVTQNVDVTSDGKELNPYMQMPAAELLALAERLVNANKPE
jgi:hypothetical protein